MLTNEKRKFLIQCIEQDHEPPNPKYALFSQCTDGKIVGYYWKSVEAALNESMMPGWWYAIATNGGESFLHENDVEGIEKIEPAGYQITTLKESLQFDLIAAYGIQEVLQNLAYIVTEQYIWQEKNSKASNYIEGMKVALENAISRFEDFSQVGRWL